MRNPAINPKQPRILVTRTDRLGDVLLALPALELIRNSFPEADIDFLAQRDPLEAIDPYLRSRSINPVYFRPTHSGTNGNGGGNGNGNRNGNGNGHGTRGDFERTDYAAALYLHAPPSVLFSGWRKGVRWRVGLHSKAPSFFLLNRGLLQHRTDVGRHEVYYNLELAKELIACLGGSAPLVAPEPIEIPSDRESVAMADDVLERAGFTSDAQFTVVHPGMGDSALNLSAHQYVPLMERIESTTRDPLVLSMGPAPRDLEIVTAIRSARPDLPVLSGMRLRVLREVLRRAQLVVAPSTGPLHLAHYVGTKTVGLYSPVRSQRRERWEPAGGTGVSTVLFPEVACPATRQCLGPSCREYPCMEKAPWGDFLEQRLATPVWSDRRPSLPLADLHSTTLT